MDDKDKSRNRLKIRLHYFLALIFLVHAILFLVYWFAIGDFRNDVDLFLSESLNFTLPYTILVMSLTALFGLWSIFRFISMRLALRKGEWKTAFWNWIYLGVGLIFLVLFYVAFVLIVRENPAQRGVIFSLGNLIRLGSDALLFLFAGIWLRRLVVYLRRRMQEASRSWLWMAGIIVSLVSLVGLWLLPTLFPPSWVYEGDLPAKPALVAHRGASMLAPENTLAAAELASEYGAFGFETDVRISLDGEPFLMHDETLARTTNIAEVFPNRVDDPASQFTLDELSQLNAGLWFIQKDPYGTIDAGMVSQSQLGINQGQSIPTLQEALDLVDEEGMVILFDLRLPAQEHPYHDEAFDSVIRQCRESGLSDAIWFLVDEDRLADVLDGAPQFTRVIGVSSRDLPEPATLLDLEYEIVNVDTGIRTRDIQGYRQRGLGVNVYTVDQAWLFSQFWLSGVTSVTTNNVHILSQMVHPVLNVPYSRYLLFWGLFGIIVAIWLASSQPKQGRPEESVSGEPETQAKEAALEFESLEHPESSETQERHEVRERVVNDTGEQDGYISPEDQNEEMPVEESPREIGDQGAIDSEDSEEEMP
jgi:glycerophosphoryl diester phosphodiesterase